MASPLGIMLLASGETEGREQLYGQKTLLLLPPPLPHAMLSPCSARR